MFAGMCITYNHRHDNTVLHGGEYCFDSLYTVEQQLCTFYILTNAEQITAIEFDIHSSFEGYITRSVLFETNSGVRYGWENNGGKTSKFSPK